MFSSPNEMLETSLTLRYIVISLHGMGNRVQDSCRIQPDRILPSVFDAEQNIFTMPRRCSRIQEKGIQAVRV